MSIEVSDWQSVDAGLASEDVRVREHKSVDAGHASENVAVGLWMKVIF